MEGRKETSIFRKGMHIDLSESDIKFERKLAKLTQQKNDMAVYHEIYIKIDELIKSGKSSGAIRLIIKKLYPKESEQLEKQKIPLISNNQFEKILREMAASKSDEQKIEEILNEIFGLINKGKTAREIRQMIREKYPELSRGMEELRVPLPIEETDRLTVQLQDRVEKFRNSIPYDTEGER